MVEEKKKPKKKEKAAESNKHESLLPSNIGESSESPKEKKVSLIRLINKQTGPESKETQDIILHKKPAKLILLLLDDSRAWYTSLLARESEQSYVYATHLIKVLKERGVIDFENRGKRKIIKLTERGEKIAKAIEEILQLSSEIPTISNDKK